MTLVRLAARPLLASMFVVGGIDSLRTAGAKAGAAEPVTDRLVPLLQKLVPQLSDDPTTLVRINGAVQVAAGLALATGRVPRLSSAVLAATLVPTTAAGHRFWEETEPGQKKAQRVQFFKNASMMGGLMLAAVDTEGKPGIAWRAQHAVGSAKREAKHLRREAKAQARLAAKSVTS